MRWCSSSVAEPIAIVRKRLNSLTESRPAPSATFADIDVAARVSWSPTWPYGPSQADVQVGDQVTLNNGLPAIVLEVRTETVLLDANHALAGESLTFEVEVLSITRPE